MNDRDGNSGNSDDYRSLLLLDEISRNDKLTQRDLSKKLGVALGLVNSYIKNLASKGYITVSTIPRNRYRYFLTPSGLAEKTRLTYQHLQNFTNLYRVARKDFSKLFKRVAGLKIENIVFCGVDEVTEIAYLSLKEAGLELTGIVDLDGREKDFFGHRVRPIESLGVCPGGLEYDLVVITSFAGGSAYREGLREAGVDEKRVCDISSEGWLKKIEHSPE
jgi:DNA-binding MarR family transcriptional regulator